MLLGEELLEFDKLVLFAHQEEALATELRDFLLGLLKLIKDELVVQVRCNFAVYACHFEALLHYLLYSHIP